MTLAGYGWLGSSLDDMEGGDEEGALDLHRML
jgi:hypothetical protein